MHTISAVSAYAQGPGGLTVDGVVRVVAAWVCAKVCVTLQCGFVSFKPVKRSGKC